MNSYVPSPMSSLRQESIDGQIDRVLDEALRAFSSSSERWTPACNVWDDDNGFYIEMALPGWEAGQLSLEINNQMLTIKGQRSAAQEDGHRYHLREFGGTSFARVFKVPAFVDHDKASAAHKNGILTVAFPKREEAKCRRILISSE